LRLEFRLAEIVCRILNGNFFFREEGGSEVEWILVGKMFHAEWILDWWWWRQVIVIDFIMVVTTMAALSG